MQTGFTYRQLIENATARLYNASQSPKVDAEILLQHTLDRPLAWLLAHGEQTAESEQVERYQALIAARQKGEPIAYLTGYKDFWSLRLAVNSHVLIPRADTETLIEQALDQLKDKHQPAVLDLGTGSGAIALTLAKERSDARVVATDKHAQALQVAQQNAASNAINSVTFMLSDWFSALQNEAQKFDLIAANPPYVADNDAHLQQGDLRFEPRTALVAEKQGIADLSHIIKSAPDYLRASGCLIVEHGFAQGEEVTQLFVDAGFRKIETHRDINQLPRCTLGIWHG